MDRDFDVCVIGSGAGGAPVAWSLARAGHAVLVLEKGPWLDEKDFAKDELACCRRSSYTPNLRDEQHVIEDQIDGAWRGTPTRESGWDFWNGNMVGGSSNLMSGYFHRLKPMDFRLKSEFGPIAGANVVDWPIAYDDLEPYYAQVERVAGISGQVHPHPYSEPRSTPDFPYPPTVEHPVSGWLDQACGELGFQPVKVARAILPQQSLGRNGCYYSGYCGSYGCSSGAKSSARTAFVDPAVATGNCQVRPWAKVQRLLSDADGKVSAAEYVDRDGQIRKVTAKIFVVACQAIETSRLLLASVGPKHPHGLGNRHGQLGRNLVFSAGGSGSGYLTFEDFSTRQVELLRLNGPFVNRALQDWYQIQDPVFGPEPAKGGTIEFLFGHANGITRANRSKWQDGQLVWGKPLKRKLERWFNEDREIKFEVFNDWLPTDDCFVGLDGSIKDRWGMPVARVRIGAHPHDLQVGRYLADKGEQVLNQLGARFVSSSVSAAPPQNLVAGGCRFGTDAKTSVLDADCRAWDAENLFVSDGSFMPTGGSVPYTFTLYANALRVADKIRQQLG